MKTMRDIELLSGVHPVLDFCLMQIKAGHISETDALMEMVVHLGVNLRECQVELERMRLSQAEDGNQQLMALRKAIEDDAVILHEPDPVLIEELIGLDPAAGSDRTAIVHGKRVGDGVVITDIEHLDPEPSAEPEPSVIPPVTASPEPQIDTRSERIKRLDEDLSPRQLKKKTRLALVISKGLFAVIFVGFFITGVMSALWYFEMWRQGAVICKPDDEMGDCLRARMPIIAPLLKKML